MECFDGTNYRWSKSHILIFIFHFLMNQKMKYKTLMFHRNISSVEKKIAYPISSRRDVWLNDGYFTIHCKTNSYISHLYFDIPVVISNVPTERQKHAIILGLPMKCSHGTNYRWRNLNTDFIFIFDSSKMNINIVHVPSEQIIMMKY